MENTNVTPEQLKDALEVLENMDEKIVDICEDIYKVKEVLVGTGIAKWKVEEFEIMLNLLKKISLKKCDVEAWTKTALIKCDVKGE